MWRPCHTYVQSRGHRSPLLTATVPVHGWRTDLQTHLSPYTINVNKQTKESRANQVPIQVPIQASQPSPPRRTKHEHLGLVSVPRHGWQPGEQTLSGIPGNPNSSRGGLPQSSSQSREKFLRGISGPRNVPSNSPPPGVSPPNVRTRALHPPNTPGGAEETDSGLSDINAG